MSRSLPHKFLKLVGVEPPKVSSASAGDSNSSAAVPPLLPSAVSPNAWEWHDYKALRIKGTCLYEWHCFTCGLSDEGPFRSVDTAEDDAMEAHDLFDLDGAS